MSSGRKEDHSHSSCFKSFFLPEAQSTTFILSHSEFQAPQDPGFLHRLLSCESSPGPLMRSRPEFCVTVMIPGAAVWEIACTCPSIGVSSPPPGSRQLEATSHIPETYCSLMYLKSVPWARYRHWSFSQVSLQTLSFHLISAI